MLDSILNSNAEIHFDSAQNSITYQNLHYSINPVCV